MNPTALPAWVEDDGLKFVECNAKGIVLFESNGVFNKIIEDVAWRSSNLLFATGCGLPRSGMRRFLHRLSVQFKFPVFILSDNDPWGYFIFSLMKRGLLAPHAECSYLAVENSFYLGLRADVDLTSSKEDFVIKWKPYWDIRFEYLMKYSCFQKKEWQTELLQFRDNQAGINCQKLLLSVGSKCFFDKYVANSIVEGRFLS
jgi:DNA topoisomerase VI subunit A